MMNRIIAVLIMLVLIPSGVMAQKTKVGEVDAAIGSERNESDGPEDTEAKWERTQRTYLLEGPIDPDSYILGPMDQLILIFGGPENTTTSLRILPEGIVVLPNIGPFAAAGYTLSEFKEKLLAALSRYYKNVDIDLQLLTPRAFHVFVLGEVSNPGPVEMHAPFRVSEALEGAGGVTVRGTLREIEIRESDQLVR
ncbi:MAG: polysaccharide biosynthesis/export family protein, partial [Candidatus Latescibacterota bacterium]